MQDFRIAQDENGFFDLSLDGADFASVDGMESAVNVSLFSDGRASEGRVPNAIDRRGWIGDVLTASLGRRNFSQLWTLDQARMTQTKRGLVSDEAERALEWMVEDGIANSVSASISGFTTRGANIRIDIETPTGETETYNVLWSNTRASNI